MLDEDDRRDARLRRLLTSRQYQRSLHAAGKPGLNITCTLCNCHDPVMCQLRYTSAQ